MKPTKVKVLLLAEQESPQGKKKNPGEDPKYLEVYLIVL